MESPACVPTRRVLGTEGGTITPTGMDLNSRGLNQVRDYIFK